MRFIKSFFLTTGAFMTAFALLALLSFHGAPAYSGGGGGGALASRNGDTNCDGRINIGDVIYLIRHLFQGGEPPCALAQNPADLDQVVNGLQEVKAQIAACCPRWPPKPSDIITVTQKDFPDQIPIPDAIFTVPQDKWFVVTDLMTSNEARFFDQRVGLIRINIYEIYDEVGKLKLSVSFKVEFEAVSNYYYHSEIGLAFRPGSKVVLTQDNVDENNFSLTGYLTSP